MSKSIKAEDEFDQNIIKSIETLLEENEPETLNSEKKSLGFKKDAEDSLKTINQIIDSDDPIIHSYLYGGSQNYTRWSGIESDELSELNQKPYIDPVQYATHKNEAVNFTPSKSHASIKASAHQFIPKQSPLQYQKTQSVPASPILPRNPAAFNPNDKSHLLLNNYLLCNYHLNSNGYFLNAGSLANNPYINLENYNFAPGNLYNQINLLNLQDAKHNLRNPRNIQYQLMQQRLLNQEQEYLKILNYYTNVKYQKSMTAAPPKAFCAFCKKNGESVYVSY